MCTTESDLDRSQEEAENFGHLLRIEFWRGTTQKPSLGNDDQPCLDGEESRFCPIAYLEF
jgi:hypothetical protein